MIPSLYDLTAFPFVLICRHLLASLASWASRLATGVGLVFLVRLATRGGLPFVLLAGGIVVCLLC